MPGPVGPAQPSTGCRKPPAKPGAGLLLALGNAGYALRGAAVALARLSRALLGLAPASLGLAMAWALRRGRALCLVSSAGAS
jgi:hypothetical protein